MLRLNATNVTGTRSMSVDVPAGLSAEEAARSIASVMSLPSNVPWALRDDGSAAYLVDADPIGGQVEALSNVSIVPKTHLG
jgi:fructose-1,6-bisphosphatase